MQSPWLFALGEGGGTRLVLSLCETRIHPTQHPFERLTPIFDHMPPIHHLLGRGRAKLSTTSILSGTVSADPLHTRMSAKPGCECFCGPVRQQIDWTVPLPVNQQSAVRETTTKRKIIYSKNGRDRTILDAASFGKT